MDAAWVLSLPEDVTVAVGADGDLTLSGPRSGVALRRLSPGLRAALHRLAAPGEKAERLAESVRNAEGPTALARWYYHLQRLASRKFLRLSACEGGERLATLEPIAPALRAAVGLRLAGSFLRLVALRLDVPTRRRSGT